MKSTYYNPLDWKNLIPDIEEVIIKLENHNLIGVGMTPYSRSIPGFFLKKYSIYTIADSCDVTALRRHIKTIVLADKYPELASKVHGTGYLTGSYAFQGYLKSLKPAPVLFLGNTTNKIISDLQKINIRSIGNLPEHSKDVELKGDFRRLLVDLNLPSLKSKIYRREELQSLLFAELIKEFDGSFVVQRADKEVGCNEGTFFVHTEEDWARCCPILSNETNFSYAIISRFVDGLSTSMLGCVTRKGTLTGPLQLQLIDIPESLNGRKANGAFYGNDLGFTAWHTDIEKDAARVVEKIGQHLYKNGYRGIFGIDFVYDVKRKEIYANECNARFTGSLILYSLALLDQKLPPFEFFHLLEHLNIDSIYDFKKVQTALKIREEYSHIALSPRNIISMEIPLLTGVYSYNESDVTLSYDGPGITLSDLKNINQFLLIDTVQKVGQKIEQGVPRLFKLIFPRSIAISSKEIDKISAFLVSRFSNVLSKASGEKHTPTT